MTTPSSAARQPEIYRIRFEAVGQRYLRLYSDADPLLYKNTRQIVPNSQIPDEHWHEIVTGERSNPWAQFNTLRKWADADTGFVRNIRLERMTNQPEWEPVDR